MKVRSDASFSFLSIRGQGGIVAHGIDDDIELRFPARQLRIQAAFHVDLCAVSFTYAHNP
jgi:hypothetical protein